MSFLNEHRTRYLPQTLYHGTGDSKCRPSVLLERMVDAQGLGKKSGRGFYEYNDN
ncbi:hypothetical protein CONPUDRAFT_154512 [Coniophora puteana RWD-64-598 SS2]|uniref:3-hydroxyacyl-CoA dehydrogenase C-terminal domain-containing protein n=1 Tax=Coniophora puteana (strain RWD-64-598) TaxID=741705 RepID=A0A5M3MPI1_CONPW|nr:uncharacterized protein CONPUDRAFT_154512 [Coniophora puteana RWD-64-598 SS2]EIW80481.1 hypothetical protein CONPUDRAFT_154512 [Coniophora puteana RWD-64-598 SS2]